MPFEDIPERNEREAAREPMPSIESPGDDVVERESDQDGRMAATPDGIVQDDGRAAEATEQSTDGDDSSPPQSAHRPDTVVRATGPDARYEMERGNDFRNEPNFTKGRNAPTLDQSRAPYTVEQMDAYLSEAPRQLFADAPGGDGATPLSPDRERFLDEMFSRGRFPSRDEAERWAYAIFNVIRQRAIEQDDALVSEFSDTVRVGEAPNVQVEEMMWGGDFVDRVGRALSVASSWKRQEFVQRVARAGGVATDDAWTDAAIYSFFGALKALQQDGTGVGNLGELQEIWDQV